MGLLKNEEFRGIATDWYFKIIGFSLNIIKKQDEEGNDIDSTELFVKVGRYIQRGGEMLDFISYVFTDVKKGDEISMASVYEMIKEKEEFADAEDVFEESEEVEDGEIEE